MPSCIPSKFGRDLNNNMCRIVRDESVAAAVCGVLDVNKMKVQIASAGGPSLSWCAQTASDQVPAPGFQVGMIASATDEE